MNPGPWNLLRFQRYSQMVSLCFSDKPRRCPQFPPGARSSVPLEKLLSKALQGLDGGYDTERHVVRSIPQIKVTKSKRKILVIHNVMIHNVQSFLLCRFCLGVGQFWILKCRNNLQITLSLNDISALKFKYVVFSLLTIFTIASSIFYEIVMHSWKQESWNLCNISK